NATLSFAPEGVEAGEADMAMQDEDEDEAESSRRETSAARGATSPPRSEAGRAVDEGKGIDYARVGGKRQSPQPMPAEPGPVSGSEGIAAANPPADTPARRTPTHTATQSRYRAEQSTDGAPQTQYRARQPASGMPQPEKSADPPAHTAAEPQYRAQQSAPPQTRHRAKQSRDFVQIGR